MNVGNNVGLHVGFMCLPDKIRLGALNDLSVACRECRDFQGQETPAVAHPWNPARADRSQVVHS